MNKVNEDMIQIAEGGSCLNIKAQLLLKVLTEGDLHNSVWVID